MIFLLDDSDQKVQIFHQWPGPQIVSFTLCEAEVSCFTEIVVELPKKSQVQMSAHDRFRKS